LDIDFLYNFLLKRFLFEEELSELCSKKYFGLQVELPLFLSGFNEILIFSTGF